MASSSQADERFCTNAVTTCGYSDPRAGSAGVPHGTYLRPSGSLTVTANGATVTSRQVTGSITIDADNVTIEDTEVIDSDPSSGAIVIDRGHHGTVIKYDTIRGVDPSSGPLAYAVYNEGSTQVLEDHVYAYNIDRILVGSGRLMNSYCVDNASLKGGHFECVYNGGGDVIVDHDTLLNTHDQTAAVYVESYSGDLRTVEVSNSILAGGSYCLYGGGEPKKGYANRGPQIVRSDRFSRLYFAKCGQYGTGAYLPSFVSWSGNVWDDTARVIPLG